MKRLGTVILAFLFLFVSLNRGLADFSIVVTKYTNSDNSLTADQFTAAQKMFQSEISVWEGALGNPPGKSVTVTIADVDFAKLALGNGGVTSGAVAAANGLPGNVNQVQISTNTDMFYGNGNPDSTHKSAATVMLHELGHAVGFNYLSGGDGYQKWNDKITGNQFNMFGTMVTLAATAAGDDANGLSHIATSYAASDLMNPTIGYGSGSVRGISQLDLCMLSAAYGYVVPYDCPEPASIGLFASGAVSLAGYAGFRLRKKKQPA